MSTHIGWKHYEDFYGTVHRASARTRTYQFDAEYIDRGPASSRSGWYLKITKRFQEERPVTLGPFLKLSSAKKVAWLLTHK